MAASSRRPRPPPCRGLCLLHHRVRLQGTEARAKCRKVLLQAASMSSMLLYIITNAVLFSFLMTHEQIPQEMAAWIIDKNFGLLVVSAGGQRPAADGRQRDGPVVDHPDHGADPVSARDQDRHQPGASRRPHDREYRSRDCAIRRSGSIFISPAASPRWASAKSPSRCCHGCARCWSSSGIDHLRPGDFAVAAAAARHDLKDFDRIKIPAITSW